VRTPIVTTSPTPPTHNTPHHATFPQVTALPDDFAEALRAFRVTVVWLDAPKIRTEHPSSTIRWNPLAE